MLQQRVALACCNLRKPWAAMKIRLSRKYKKKGRVDKQIVVHPPSGILCCHKKANYKADEPPEHHAE